MQNTDGKAFIYGRIPALDGWRGVAISLVLIDHFVPSAGPFHAALWSMGQHGVTIFFIVSGYIITSRLAREKNYHGTISLTSFYRRRFFRLGPCAWTYLALVLLVEWIVHRPAWWDMAGSLFCFRNLMLGVAITRHFWSLSQEEQFYIFWPAILLFFQRRASILLAAFVAVGIATFRFLHWGSYEQFPQYFRPEVRADALLVGCLLALLWQELERAWRTWMIVPCLCAMALCLIRYQNLPPLIESIVIAALIGLTLHFEEHWLARALRARPVVAIGLVSYSLYVWQAPFALGVSRRWQLLPIAIPGLAVTTFLSYRFLELPGLAWGRRRRKGEEPEMGIAEAL